MNPATSDWNSTQLQLAVGAASFDQHYDMRHCARVGGMGEIWRAWDRLLEREVAIKMIRRKYSSETMALNKFEKEVKLHAKLMHPRIPPIFDHGTTGEGLPFFTMRYVEGPSFQTILNGVHAARRFARTPLTLPPLMKIFLDICEGVEFAHSRGVLHCDLKPDNVLLSQFYEVFVIDWGLARITREPERQEWNRWSLYGAGESQIRTTVVISADDSSPLVVGTPGYMSSEQATGAWELIDETTDIVGLGGILYSILTGEAPYASPGESCDIAIRRSREGDAKPVRARHVEIPARLEAICAKCLAKDGSARYPTVTALKADIREWMERTNSNAFVW